MTSLNPVFTIGSQLARGDRDAPRRARGASAADELAVALLERVGIPDAAQPARQLSAPVLGRHAPARDDRDGAGAGARAPHRRRAHHRARRHHPGADPRAARSRLSARPARRSSSSPTTSGWWRETADRVAVMYGGRIVETAPARELFRQPLHPYTQGLLDVAAAPRLDRAASAWCRSEGQPPDPSSCRAGCTFAPRCRGAECCCARRSTRAARARAGALVSLHVMASAWPPAWDRRARFHGRRTVDVATPSIPTRGRATPRRRDDDGPARGRGPRIHFPIHSGVLLRRTSARSRRSTASRSRSTRRDAGTGRRDRAAARPTTAPPSCACSSRPRATIGRSRRASTSDARSRERCGRSRAACR